MKIIILLLINIGTGYLLIAGIKNHEMIGFVKNHDGTFDQPWTFTIQVTGWLIIFFIYLFTIFYFWLLVKKPSESVV